MNKKGIELSVNFMVMLIMALVVFGFGIKFAYDIIEGAENVRDTYDYDSMIDEILCEPNDLVCFSEKTEEVQRGDDHLFGLRIYNTLGSNCNGGCDFYIKVTDSSEELNIKGGYNLNDGRKVNLANYKEGKYGILVDVPDDATTGTKILNVSICYSDTSGAEDTAKCGSGLNSYGYNKLYVIVK